MSSSDHQNAIPICTIDPLQYMQIKLHSDGTITRFLEMPSIKATPDSTSLSPVLSKDFPLNPSHKTSLRIFIPKIAFETNNKLPIIVYCHGGGFVILRVDTCVNHEFCEALALNLPAIVVSVDYRLAPEHRLPAAYEDAMQALQWIRDGATTQTSEWLSKYGDFDNCFLMGSSAGGNIAYHSAIRALDIVNELQPLRLKGLILHQPFFGGSKRTGSEIRHIDHPCLPLSGNDLFWELGLPIGVDRDHEFCNPIVGDCSSWLKKLKELSLRVLVIDCSGDPLMDRSMDLVAILKDKGVNVKGDFTEGGYHGVGLIDSNQRESLMLTIKEFVISSIDE
ncbi:carboxylesterase 1-like [Silene latifolia]|uniref:carboxylesterase 1-like n=1 Tax=Silene latifolia TaxID=37657 RepID=UPI003D77CB0D